MAAPGLTPTPRPSPSLDGIDPKLYRRRWWTLSVLTLSLVMVIMGNSSLNVAMPTFVKELGTSDTELQWIVDGYALVFGGLLLTMGALGDRFGRRGALQIGLLIFGLASMWAALFATEPWHLIASRSVMGFAGALVMPATLSILTTVFPKGERGKAIGIWAAFAGLGGMIGIISSGWLLEHFSWNSIFWLNVPVAAVALLAGLALVPTSRDPNQSPLDIIGSILSIFALGGILYAIIEGPESGWTSPLIMTVGLGSIALGFVFVWWEKRTKHPMLPMSFFKERGFNSGVSAVALVFFAMFAVFFVLTQYIQFIQGFSPLAAGVRFLPLGLGMIAGAPNSDRLVKRFGARRVVGAGMFIAAIGLTSLGFLPVDAPYWRLGATLVLLGAGMGLTMAPATAVIMSSIPAAKAGVGSSMNDTAREVGGAFGIAILGTILKDIFSRDIRNGLPSTLSPEQTELASSGLGKALALARQVGGPEGAQIASVAKQAFVDAMAPAFWSAAALVLVAAVLVTIYFPRREHPEAPHGQPAAELAPEAP